MTLSSNLERLQDAVELHGNPALDEALANLQHGVAHAEALRDAVLTNHRERHTTVAAHLCDEACRLAAEW
jgi:hypothetical protein